LPEIDDAVLDLGELQYHGPDLARWVASPQSVLLMLLDAGEPEPWLRPWARRDWSMSCALLANCMNFPLGNRVMPDGSCKIHEKNSSAGDTRRRPQARTKMDRAHAAMQELRLTLPKIISRFDGNAIPAYFERPWGGVTKNERVRKLRESETETYKRIVALLKSLPPRPKVKLWYPFDAARLMDCYCKNVNASAGISSDGSAVCFIEEALKRMGYRNLPPHRRSIASALRRTIPDWEYVAAEQSLSHYL
jgi:hypothetical protein